MVANEEELVVENLIKLKTLPWGCPLLDGSFFYAQKQKIFQNFLKKLLRSYGVFRMYVL